MRRLGIRIVPTVWFAALVAAAAVGFPFYAGADWRWFAVAEGALVVLLGIDVLLCVPPKQIGVTRSLPDTVTVGERAEVAWAIENRGTRPVRVTVGDTVWPSLRPTRHRADVRVGPSSRHRFTAHLEPSRRGRFPFSEVTVRAYGPMRLGARQQARAVDATLRVMPGYPSRDEMRRRMRVPFETGLRSVRTRGSGTEFDQLREYRPGDEVRRIDWAATARQQRAIVRDYRAERNQHVVILLDNGRVMAGTIGDSPRVEHAMDAVFGLSQVAVAIGDNVGMVAFDAQVRAIVPSSGSKAQFSRMAEAMYLLEPELSESAYRVAFNQATARFRRRSLFVVLTDLVESVVASSLLPALPVLTRTHLVMVAAVRDPEIEAWAAGSGHEWASEAYRSAAAVATLDARARVAARLRAAGAVVVDAAPGRLAVDVVDTYLELKSTGRL
jgi:uncharacterized protein (DUF58 family)